MDLELRDRVVLTGATDGLGAELAAALVSEGATVVGCGRNEERVAAAAEHLGDSASILAADVTAPRRPRTNGDPRRCVDTISIYADMAKSIPLGRVGRAPEYADLVSYLVWPRASASPVARSTSTAGVVGGVNDPDDDPAPRGGRRFV
jgi:hypothetical protein